MAQTRGLYELESKLAPVARRLTFDYARRRGSGVMGKTAGCFGLWLSRF